MSHVIKVTIAPFNVEHTYYLKSKTKMFNLTTKLEEAMVFESEESAKDYALLNIGDHFKYAVEKVN